MYNKNKLYMREPDVHPDFIVWATPNDSCFVVTHNETGYCYQIACQDLIRNLKKKIKQAKTPLYMATKISIDSVLVLNEILRDCDKRCTIYQCSSAKKMIKDVVANFK